MILRGRFPRNAKSKWHEGGIFVEQIEAHGLLLFAEALFREGQPVDAPSDGCQPGRQLFVNVASIVLG
jgi:hypothetical protein